MPESLDQHLEADIARTLKYNALVTPIQHEDARSRLLRSAAAQTALPPVPAESVQLLPQAHTQALREQMLRVWRFLVVDSICYERARRPQNFFQYYYMHGRGAYRIIHVAA